MDNMKHLNQYIAPTQQDTKWEETPDGFLRCRLRVLSEGIMPYARGELGEIPCGCDVDPISLFVPLNEMKASHSIRSLEGAPVVTGQHDWITPQTIKELGKGHVAGTPHMDGPWLCCDVLITDPEAIQDIKDKKFTDVSAAYTADTLFEDGKSYEGSPYQASQVGLRYNHIAIIESGTGRGGMDVRILNKNINPLKGETKMAEETSVVKVKLTNTQVYINTDEAGATAISADEKKVSGDMEGILNEVEGSNAALATLQKENEELKGQLAVYKERLDAAMNPEVIQSAAENMIDETKQADEIVENCADVQDKKEFQNSIKNIHGSELHKAVLSKVGLKIENMSDGELRGAFLARSQIAKSIPLVNGTKFNNTIIPKNTQGAPIQRTNLEKLGFSSSN